MMWNWWLMRLRINHLSDGIYTTHFSSKDKTMFTKMDGDIVEFISNPLRICKSPSDMIGNRVQFTLLGKVIGEKSQNKVNIFFNIFHMKHLQLQSKT